MVDIQSYEVPKNRPEHSDKTSDLTKVTDKLYNIILVSSTPEHV